MNDQENHDSLVRSLYEAALNPAAWSDSLPEMARQSGADNIHLLVWDPVRPEPSFSLAPGMTEDMEMSYRAHYGAIDPRRLLVSERAAGNWMACHHHFDARTVGRSEFFQDYLIPGGIRYLLGTCLVRHGGLDVFVGMHRAPGRQPFSDAELHLVRRLTGHFQQAVRLWLGTEDLRQQAAIGGQGMDAVELGIVAIDTDGRVKYANRYAEALMREGKLLHVRQGKLAATEPGDAQRLQGALRQAATTRHGQSLGLGSVKRADTSPCHVVVVPIGPEGPLAMCVNPARLLVLISYTRRRRMLTVQQLMLIFGLSPAEARLARSLGAGDSMDSYAKTAGLSINTVKTQLQSIFAKTGTTRQAELARQIAVIPVVRERPMSVDEA